MEVLVRMLPASAPTNLGLTLPAQITLRGQGVLIQAAETSAKTLQSPATTLQCWKRAETIHT